MTLLTCGFVSAIVRFLGSPSSAIAQLQNSVVGQSEQWSAYKDVDSINIIKPDANPKAASDMDRASTRCSSRRASRNRSGNFSNRLRPFI